MLILLLWLCWNIIDKGNARCRMSVRCSTHNDEWNVEERHKQQHVFSYTQLCGWNCARCMSCGVYANNLCASLFIPKHPRSRSQQCSYIFCAPCFECDQFFLIWRRCRRRRRCFELNFREQECVLAVIVFWLSLDWIWRANTQIDFRIPVWLLVVTVVCLDHTV